MIVKGSPPCFLWGSAPSTWSSVSLCPPGRMTASPEGTPTSPQLSSMGGHTCAACLRCVQAMRPQPGAQLTSHTHNQVHNGWHLPPARQLPQARHLPPARQAHATLPGRKPMPLPLPCLQVIGALLSLVWLTGWCHEHLRSIGVRKRFGKSGKHARMGSPVVFVSLATIANNCHWSCR
jgi:hypothetical protein